MSSESDLIKLYSTRLLALAADIPRLGRLSAPEGTALVRSPTCGSSIRVDLCIDGERIIDFAQEVRACALGQAAASVVGKGVVGATEAQVRQARAELHAMLTKADPPPSPPFEGLSALVAARDHRNRHPSILLALDATIAAIEQARASRTT